MCSSDLTHTLVHTHIQTRSHPDALTHTPSSPCPQSPDPDSSAVLTNTPTLTLALAFPCQSYSPGDSPSPVPPLTVQSPVPLTSWEPTDWGQRSPQSWEDRPSAKCAMSQRDRCKVLLTEALIHHILSHENHLRACLCLCVCV